MFHQTYHFLGIPMYLPIFRHHTEVLGKDSPAKARYSLWHFPEDKDEGGMTAERWAPGLVKTG